MLVVLLDEGLHANIANLDDKQVSFRNKCKLNVHMHSEKEYMLYIDATMNYLQGWTDYGSSCSVRLHEAT